MKAKKDVKNQVKKAQKLRNECERKYPDWKNDQYNHGCNLFVWAYPVIECAIPSFVTENYATIYFNRETGKYYMEFPFQAALGFDDYVTLLSTVVKADFEKFLSGNLINVNKINKKEIREKMVPLEEDWLSATTLEELYVRFEILLKGLKASKSKTK